MSMITTSASCLSATPRATVAPTLPAPPTTVTLRFMSTPDRSALRSILHVFDDGAPELRRLQLGRIVHQPREVVGHVLGADRGIHALDDEVRGLVPTEVPQHHLA